MVLWHSILPRQGGKIDKTHLMKVEDKVEEWVMNDSLLSGWQQVPFIEAGSREKWSGLGTGYGWGSYMCTCMNTYILFESLC